MHSPRKRNGTFRLLAALVVGGALMVSAGVAASAAPTIDPTKNDASITVHKYEKPATATALPNDGREISPSDPVLSGLTPLNGVTFTAKKVNGIDLSTNAGWEALKTLTPTNLGGHTLGTAATQVTAGGGVATFSNLAVGLYLVEETVTPSGYLPAEPFLVTVPITDPANLNDWLYNVHVYPKNATFGDKNEKTVDDTGKVKLGDVITWNIYGEIPDAAVIDGYRIVDPLDSKLSYTNGTTIVKFEKSATTLAEGTDYVLTEATSGTPAKTTVTIDFTVDGRAKLVAARATDATDRVQVTIPTTVNTVGTIENTALVYPNAASFSIQPGQPGGPVNPSEETHFGDLLIEKVEAGKSTVKLKDAEFQIFKTRADAIARTGQIEVGGATTFTTNASGQIMLTGLRVSDWANGERVTSADPGYQSYWLVETKAPAGYSLLAEPYEVVVNDYVAGKTTPDYTIEDALNNGGFTLPLTGSVLSASLFYGGGALIIAGVVFMIVRQRRLQAAKA